MKAIKVILISVAMLAFANLVNADCTVTTPCGDYTFTEDSVSASASTSNGVVTVTITSNGQVLETVTCPGFNANVSTSCSGGNGGGNTGGGFDICDFFPSFWGC